MQLTPFKIVSLFSWLFLVVTSLVSFYNPIKSINAILFIIKMKLFWLSLGVTEVLDESVGYIAALMNYGFLYFCFILAIICIVLSGCAIFYFSFKDEQQISGIYENISQFHFIPLLCISALFIIGESNNFEGDSPNDASFIFNFIFTAIALGSLIFIHIKTNVTSKIAYYVIKQATYGSLIALLVYNFFFSIWFYGVIDSVNNILDSGEILDFTKNCYITFSIFIGLINSGLTLFLKNVMIGLMNLFIYLGMTVYFFRISKKIRDERGNGVAEGVIDIIMMVINLAVLSFTFIKYRAELMQSA